MNALAWAVFFGAVPVLWASGIILFVRSEMPRAKKIGWALFLVAVGVAVGSLLPLPAIRNRLLLVLAILPVLAVIDVQLARSNRSFWFWFRACAFEVCTVFGSAAITRAILRSM